MDRGVTYSKAHVHVAIRTCSSLTGPGLLYYQEPEHGLGKGRQFRYAQPSIINNVWCLRIMEAAEIVLPLYSSASLVYVPRLLPVHQCCTLKKGRAWQAKSRRV